MCGSSRARARVCVCVWARLRAWARVRAWPRVLLTFLKNTAKKNFKEKE